MSTDKTSNTVNTQPQGKTEPLINDEKVQEKVVASLDDQDSERMVKMTSKDGKKYDIKYQYALISSLVKTGTESDKNDNDVPIPGVTSNILEEIIKYMEHHKGTEPAIVEKPLRSKQMKDVCKESWDAEFIDKIGETRQQLYDLILAANYMDIKSLLHLGCAKVASLIKGQPLEKIKEILSQGTQKTDKPEESKKE